MVLDSETIDSITHIFFTFGICKPGFGRRQAAETAICIARVDGTNLPTSMHLAVIHYYLYQRLSDSDSWSPDKVTEEKEAWSVCPAIQCDDSILKLQPLSY